MTALLLEVCGISKSFPGVKALADVRFDLRPGEIHALMGENGAGKSTLIKILCGVFACDCGEIRLNSQPVEIDTPTRAHALGISSVHQELHLEPHLSVAENIFLGRQPTGRFGFIDRRRMTRDAARLLTTLGVSIDPERPVGALSVAERQIVAIARAVSISARVMIFDEPTSSLSHHETELLFGIIRKLRDQGLGIIYVSHRMEEVFTLCDRVTVLRDGHFVGAKDVAQTSLAEIVGMMIGRQVDAVFQKTPAAIGAEILIVRDLSKSGILDGVSFSVRCGEIVGLAGLVGAGRTDLARAIFGDLDADGGEIIVDGIRVHAPTPRRAIAAGIGLIPEDRKEQGLVTRMSVRENISMPQLQRLARFGVLAPAKEKALAQSYVHRLSIRTPDIEQKVMYLSGGNQQRVVIAKWLAMQPRVLIVDEPTRGVDVGAKAEIHRLLRDLARSGMGILMISSDLPELMAISDRILVMHEGRLTGNMPANTATQAKIMRCAMGQSDLSPFLSP